MQGVDNYRCPISIDAWGSIDFYPTFSSSQVQSNVLINLFAECAAFILILMNM